MARVKEKPIDHIGWDLFRASQTWKEQFRDGMVARGHGWFGEARGSLFQHIGGEGIAQTDLAARTGLTKQAVQQQLDDLVRDGIVTRIEDPGDARRRLVAMTPAGHDARAASNEVKRAIEADYERRIGADGMAALKSALREIIG